MITARGIVNAYKAMAYDAVAVSIDDLSAGAEFFQRSTASGFPFVAANVYDKHANRLFSPHLIKNIGQLTVGIIGLTGGTASNSDDFVIEDWQRALREEIALLEKNCTLLVVLSNLSEQENDALQRDFSQIDIIVTASKKGSNLRPRQSPSSLLVQGGSQGKYMGKLDVTIHGEGNWTIASSDTLEQYQNRLIAIDQQLSSLEKQAGTNTDVSRKKTQLQTMRQICLDQIARQKTAQAGGENKPGKTYQSFFLPVQPVVTSIDTVGLIVEDIKKKIKINHE